MPGSSCGWRTPRECYGRDLPGGELSGQSFKGDPSPSWNPVVEFDGYELNDNRSTDRDFTTSLDFTIPYGLGSLPASLRLGGKARIKKKDRQDNITIYDGFDGDYVLSDVVGGFEDKSFFKGGCKGCYEVGRIANGKKSWEFYQSNRSLFELDGDGTREDSDADYESTRPMSATNS